MNAQAIAVQHAAARPIMYLFHVFFSVGGLLGATTMTLLLRAGLLPISGAAGLAVALLALGAFWITRVSFPFAANLRESPRRSGLRQAQGSCSSVRSASLLCWRKGPVLDGTVVFLRELRQVDTSLAGVGYAVFSVTDHRRDA